MTIRESVSKGFMMLAGLAMASAALAQTRDCGNPFDKASNGPYDYRTAETGKKAMVESRHFNEDVRMLRRGSTTKNIAGDIGYTLNVYPNHHEALMKMGEWSIRSGRNPPEGTKYTVECWFERGIRFRPDDPMVRMVFGIYLFKKGQPQKSVKQFEAALEHGGDSPNLRYNLGLAYLEAGDHAKALESAHRAYAGGFALPGLKEKLKRAGYWREPQARETSGHSAVAQ